MSTVKYYYVNGRLEIYDKYTIDIVGTIRDKKKNREISQHTTKNGYKHVTLFGNEGKRISISVHRIMASTFLGAPPTHDHTPDHDNRNRSDNTLDNILWKEPTEQKANQKRPDVYKSAFIVVKDGTEKTIQEWVKHLKDNKTIRGNPYTKSVISAYAQRKTNGFSYKTFDNLPGEIWKEISGSKNRQGQWKISNKNRVKYVTNYAENIINISQMSIQNGYPVIGVNGKQLYVHHICFQVFNPEVVIQPGEIIRHKYDNKLDFRPENLLIGTFSENGSDAHDNGKYDGTKTARKSCVSYINGAKEKVHISLSDAARYLKDQGYKSSNHNEISNVVGTCKTAYDRTWKLD